jgi:hypothetical protein
MPQFWLIPQLDRAAAEFLRSFVATGSFFHKAISIRVMPEQIESRPTGSATTGIMHAGRSDSPAARNIVIFASSDDLAPTVARIYSTDPPILSLSSDFVEHSLVQTPELAVSGSVIQSALCFYCF